MENSLKYGSNSKISLSLKDILDNLIGRINLKNPNSDGLVLLRGEQTFALLVWVGTEETGIVEKNAKNLITKPSICFVKGD